MIEQRMNRGRMGTALLAALLVAAAGAACAKKMSTDTYETILQAFADPPAEFRSAPLWVWNDLMTREEIARQLEEFKAQGIGGAFIHPRPGLITPYLSDEWFDLCAHAVETGKSLGLKIWLYDENSYPSGFAGGHVPAQMPDAALSGLRMSRVQGPLAELPEPPAVALRKTLTGFEDVTGKLKTGGGDQSVYYLFEVVRSQPSPWHGGFPYVDLMRKEVTEKFLDLTLNAYKRAIGKEFGQTVPGVFQDEAEIAPAGGREAVSYTPALFPAFLAKWAYDLRPHLVSLFEEVGDWRRVRHNYYSVLLDLFIENWAKPYYAYATDNNLVFTGHYWEHEWPSPRVSPDNLAMAAYAHMPGIDMLMNEWDEGPHAQFGNARSVREVRSAANQLGRRRTLSETYGASGWDLTFFDQKRIGDWQYALGVNFLNQHLSYATIKGARKRDHPPSFSDHEPWWGSYRTLADYFARLSAVLSLGQQVNRILVIEPTTSAWMYYSPSGSSGSFESIASDFQSFIHLLEAEHIEYDLASEKTLQEFAQARFGKLHVGDRGYELVVLPPGLKNLNDGTVVLLKDFLMRRGKIVSWVAPPDYVNGILTEDLRVLQNSYGDRWLDSGPGSGFDKIRAAVPPAVAFSEPSTHRRLFHQRREFDGGRFVFLANADADGTAEGRVSIEGGSVEVWDPFTGRVEPVPFERREDRVEVRFSIPGGGSLLLCVRDHKGKPVPAGPAVAWEEVAAAGGTTVEATALNVLTLDHCDLVLGGRRERGLYFYEAQRRAFQFHGLERNPWDSAVQYKTNILDLDKFPGDSGFEAVFGFRAVKGDALDFRDVRAVVERPEVFRVSVNGRAVEPAPGEWWLDRAFAVYPIGAHLVSGANTVTVRAKPFTIHSELEPIYLLGEFCLRSADSGFELHPPAPMTVGPWAAQGRPFYGSSVRYRRTFVIPEGDQDASYRLELGSWRGSTAEVYVGYRRVGTAAFAPHSVNLTGALVPGPNEITVVVTGTLKNTLGPFHNDPPLGRAWPGAFRQGAEGGRRPPGSAYHVVDYGLFEDFKLLRGRDAGS
jgi:hypothetical protein